MKEIILTTLNSEFKKIKNVFEEIGLIHISIVGSFSYLKNNQWNDLDIYMVFEDMCSVKYNKTLSIIGNICNTLKNKTGKEWFVETRRGAFKNDNMEMCQVHLLIEDKNSINSLPYINGLNWINNGQTIWGYELIEIIDYSAAKTNSLISGYNELKAILDALKHEYVSYKKWNFNGRNELIIEKQEVLSKEELLNLIQFSFQTGSIIYNTALNPTYKIDNKFDPPKFANKTITKEHIVNHLEKLIIQLNKHVSERSQTRLFTR